MYLPERVPSQPAASASDHVVGHLLQNFLFLNELQLIFRRKEAFKNIDMFISDRLSCHNNASNNTDSRFSSSFSALYLVE